MRGANTNSRIVTDTTIGPQNVTTINAIDRATPAPAALIIEHGAVDHVTALDAVQTSAVGRESGTAPSTCPNMAIRIAVRAAVAVDHVIVTAFMN